MSVAAQCESLPVMGVECLTTILGHPDW